MAIPPVAPGVQDQSVGGFEDVRRMPAPPQPMQPRPSLVVGGPAYFTPEGYQAPVQPEQAFMPTDRRPDAIGDNFRRPYERPIMPMPSPTPPPEMAQPAPPRVPIEQPIEGLNPVDPGPVRPMPVMPMPEPTPQPKYDPYAPSEMGARIAAGGHAYRVEGDPSSGYLMNIYWMDDQGRIQNTTEGWSRVPKQFRNKVYRTREEAEKESENMRTFEDRGNVDTTPRRTPITAPAPAPQDPVSVGGPGKAFLPDTSVNPSDYNLTDMRARGPGEAKLAVEPDSYFPMPSPMKPITLPTGQTVQIPDIDMEAVNASLSDTGTAADARPPMLPMVEPEVTPQTPPPPPPRYIEPLPGENFSDFIQRQKEFYEQNPDLRPPNPFTDSGRPIVNPVGTDYTYPSVAEALGAASGEASAPVVPQTMAPQPMPSMPSLPSVTLPTLPTLGSRPSLTRSPMRGNPRER